MTEMLEALERAAAGPMDAASPSSPERSPARPRSASSAATSRRRRPRCPATHSRWTWRPAIRLRLGGAVNPARAGDRRGYVRCVADRSLWRTDLRMVTTVSRPDAPVYKYTSFAVEDGKAGTQPLLTGSYPGRFGRSEGE
jgi:hypothetical protein